MSSRPTFEYGAPYVPISRRNRTMTDPTPERCPAAHPEDPTPCGGPIAVTILDNTGAGADGCEHHAARLLASMDDARPVSLPEHPGAAIRVHKAAQSIRPFPWYLNAPRTEPSQRSHAENRQMGEGK